MKDAMLRLLKVKSIITIALTILFFILSMMGVISGDKVFDIFLTIIAFYFGTQKVKEGGDNGVSSDDKLGDFPNWDNYNGFGN